MNTVTTNEIIRMQVLVKASVAAGRPAHYTFSRHYWEGGYKYCDWYGLGFTGKKYYHSFYQNMGSMLQEIPKETFDKGIEGNLNNSKWDTITIGEPNWQMMEH